ncbi:MAG: hypothetical protein R3Y53_00770 [Bacillota bacterium]
MKLAIIGSRGITNIDLSQYVSEDVRMIVSGGAKGIDTLAEAYADKKRLSKCIIRPEYKKYGKGGAIIRNKEIVDFADEVLAFWDGKSKGTKSVIAYANEIGKVVQIVEV